MLVNAVRSVRFGVTTTYTQVLYTARRAVLYGSLRGLPDLRLTLQINRCIQINKTVSTSSVKAPLFCLLGNICGSNLPQRPAIYVIY